jgi:ribosome-associated protein
MEDFSIETIDLAREIVDIIADKKGEDIVLLDIREQTVIADFFVICTANSERQIKAIAEGIHEEIKKRHGLYARFDDSEATSGWVLMDYADIIVHIFSPEVRNFYDLEGFWREAAVLLKMQ